MKTESELLHFYNSTLKNLLEPLEKYRVDQLEKIKKYFFLSLPFILTIIAGIVIKSKITVIASTACSILFISLSLNELTEMVSYLKKHFKYKIMSEIMYFLFDDYEYIPNQKISKSVLDKSMLIPTFTTSVDGEDFMRFKIGETHIMFCETFTYSFKNEVSFEGLFISATFNKKFKTQTFVIHKNYFKSLLYAPKFSTINLEKIKLEDIAFNNEFQTLSTDQVEARYILTPSLMQRILDYKKKTGKNISLSFVENRLYCIIPKFSNHFEPAIFRPFDFEFIKYTCEPLKLYTDLVEDLNLNLRIWTKVEE